MRHPDDHRLAAALAAHRHRGLHLLAAAIRGVPDLDRVAGVS